MRWSMFAILLCICLISAGCGAQSVSVYPVKGKLMRGGVPLGDLYLVLSPVDSEKNIPFAAATVKPDGTFELKSSDGRMGAAIGTYKVVLSAAAAENEDPMAAMLAMRDQMEGKGGAMDPAKLKPTEIFPKEYKDVSTSPKTIEIKGEELNLEIVI
jgi:hypothetical protein